MLTQGVDQNIIDDRDARLGRLFSGKENIYLFGANGFAASLMEHLPCKGIVDDFFQGMDFNGVPVLRSSSLRDEHFVVNCVTGIKPLSAQKVINERVPPGNSVSYFEILRSTDLDIKDVLDFRATAAAHRKGFERLSWLYGALLDEQSRQTLQKLYAFYATGNLTPLSGFTDHQKDQYFDVFPDGTFQQGVFFDVGAYDGQTTLQYITLDPGFKAAHVFEPIPANMKTCHQTLSQYTNVRLHQVATGDISATVFFNENGTASAQSSQGKIEISVKPIDELANDDCTFMKLDVEGAEIATLKGAEQVIRRCQPLIAITVYHCATDYIKIPELLSSYLPNHKIKMRHYTEGSTETVLYFIPEAMI